MTTLTLSQAREHFGVREWGWRLRADAIQQAANRARRRAKREVA